MANINRSNDSSQQRTALHFNENSTISSGETGVLAYVPYPCVLQAAQAACFSVASDVNILLTINRFIPGTGFTTINLGSTFLPADFGVSGVLSAGVSLPAAGSAELKLMTNDVLGYVIGGGATALVDGISGCFVVKPVQDLKVFLGRNTLA